MIPGNQVEGMKEIAIKTENEMIEIEEMTETEETAGIEGMTETKGMIEEEMIGGTTDEMIEETTGAIEETEKTINFPEPEVYIEPSGE